MDNNEIYEAEVVDEGTYEAETENESTCNGTALIVGALIGVGVGIGVAATKIAGKIKAKREAKKAAAQEENVPKLSFKERIVAKLDQKLVSAKEDQKTEDKE